MPSKRRWTEGQVSRAVSLQPTLPLQNQSTLKLEDGKRHDTSFPDPSAKATAYPCLTEKWARWERWSGAPGMRTDVS